MEETFKIMIRRRPGHCRYCCVNCSFVAMVTLIIVFSSSSASSASWASSASSASSPSSRVCSVRQESEPKGEADIMDDTAAVSDCACFVRNATVHVDKGRQSRHRRRLIRITVPSSPSRCTYITLKVHVTSPCSKSLKWHCRRQ